MYPRHDCRRVDYFTRGFSDEVKLLWQWSLQCLSLHMILSELLTYLKALNQYPFLAQTEDPSSTLFLPISF
jgi:hypothetical protein